MDESTMRPDQKDTTYIINTESGAETARIVLQAKEVNKVTGLFPNAVLSSIPVDASVLDIGCGPGTWALDVAFDYPVMEITAVDVSKTIIDYAQATALTQNIHNVSFEVVDVLGTSYTGFTEQSFDVVHIRFAAGWVPEGKWLPLLTHLYQLLDSGGWLISTEGEWPYTTSSALHHLNKLLSRAMHNAGLGLAPGWESQGVVARMGNLLYKAGFHQTGVECHALDFSGYHPREFKIWYDDFVAIYQLARPFILKHVPGSEDMVNYLYDQMIQQMWELDFCGIGCFYTYYAQKP